MSKHILIFIVILFLSSLFQVGIFAIPVGILVLLSWFLLRGTKHLVLLTLTYTVFMASLSNIPGFVVLLATTVPLSVFIAGRSYLPRRPAVAATLFIACLALWESTLFILLKISP